MRAMHNDSLGAMDAGEALDRPLFEPSMRATGRLFQALMAQDMDKLRLSYHDAISFSSPVFPDLRREMVMSGWQYMLEDIKDLRLEYEVLYADERKVQVAWRCQYQKASRSVRFKGISTMSLWDDQIVRQVDEWNFSQWARRHFGLKGILLSWSRAFQRHCQQLALDALHSRSTGYR